MMTRLNELGVMLISATERNLDDTPAGRAMHGMIAVFNQYQVDVSGLDIQYKMGQKVIAHGGTVSKTYVGYLNVREVFEGRRVSSVAVDEERALYVLESFELFATDEYTEATLHELMVARGMTTPPTLKHPARPIALSTFGKMLRNRYYLGEVFYRGQWYKGRHPAIITPELFDRVQRVLDSHSGSGARSRKWNHYLKGVFWCARCGSRMIFQRAKGNGGTYYYFACSKKRLDHTCDQPYVLADVLDRELLRYFAGAHLADDLRERIAHVMDETLADEQAVQTRVRARLSARLKELDKQEDRY